MVEQPVLDAATQLAKPRAIEHLAPGSWWVVDYVEEDGQPAQMWAQVRIAKTFVGNDGARFAGIGGVTVDGSWSELVQLRGYGVPLTLRAAEARKVGLEVPADA